MNGGGREMKKGKASGDFVHCMIFCKQRLVLEKPWSRHISVPSVTKFPYLVLSSKFSFLEVHFV
jgi:hypothetical protein